MPAGDQGTKPVDFGSVEVGGWFKERLNGTWHLKTSPRHGMYQRWGTRYEPSFSAGETVFVQ